MTNLLSWHKAGQKVTPVDRTKPWTSALHGTPFHEGPVPGNIYEISEVCLWWKDQSVSIRLVEDERLFAADRFRPVYPTVIDQLRSLDAPVPEREVVDA